MFDQSGRGWEDAFARARQRVDVDEFEWAQRTLPANRDLVVLTRRDRAQKGRVRLLPLREWLVGDSTQ